MNVLLGSEQKQQTLRTRDLRFRIAYSRPELERVLPFGRTTLDEMIKRKVFPDGLRPHSGARKIWPRKMIEEWLERCHAENGRAF